MENNNTPKVSRRSGRVNEEPEVVQVGPTEEDRELVTSQSQALAAPIVELAAPIEQIVYQVELFQKLKARLLGKEDYQLIQNKKFIKKSGWRKFALAFNISDEIIKEERVEYMTPTQNSQMYFAWEVTVKATAPNGRYSVATASCASNERSGGNTEHNIRATAATRAKNRAISDLIGGGEVSAEEVDQGDPGATQPNYGNARPQGAAAPRIQNPGEPMSDKQRGMIFGTLSRIGKDQGWLEEKIAKPVETLTKGGAAGVIDQLLRVESELKAKGKAPQEDIPTVQLEDEGDYKDQEYNNG